MKSRFLLSLFVVASGWSTPSYAAKVTCNVLAPSAGEKRQADPIIDQTHHILSRKLLLANQGRPFKIIFVYGGSGEHIDILSKYFGRPKEYGGTLIFEHNP